MVGYYGNFCLGIALLLSLIQTLGIIPNPMSRLSRPACQTANLFTTASFISLVILFLANKQHYGVVQQNVEDSFTYMQRLFAIWQNHESIMLFYAVAITGFGTAYILMTKKTISDLLARSVIGAQGFVQTGLYIYILFFASPFDVPVEASHAYAEINQPPLYIHHFVLYLGYVATSVIYSLVLGILLEGKRIKAWVTFSLPWIKFSALTIATGLLLGHFTYFSKPTDWTSIEINAFLTLGTCAVLLYLVKHVQENHLFKKGALFLGIVTFYKAFVLNILSHPLYNQSVASVSSKSRDLFFILGYFTFGFFVTSIMFLARIKQSYEENQT